MARHEVILRVGGGPVAFELTVALLLETNGTRSMQTRPLGPLRVSALDLALQERPTP